MRQLGVEERAGRANGRWEWLSVAVIAEAVLRLNRSWVALPGPARRAWWRTLAVGVAVTCLATALLVWSTRALDATGALRWESGALVWMGRDAPVSFSTGMWLEGIGNGFVLWAVMLYAAGVSAWRRLPLHTLGFLLGYTLAYLPIAFAWWLWDRSRPGIIGMGIADPGGFFHAFPSGHMVQATFAYGMLFTLWIRAAASGGERAVAVLLLSVLLGLVGLGRLRIGVHWPTDIAGGWILGGIWLAFVVLAMDRARMAASAPG